jgi:hypothetical protein
MPEIVENEVQGLAGCRCLCKYLVVETIDSRDMLSRLFSIKDPGAKFLLDPSRQNAHALAPSRKDPIAEKGTLACPRGK